MSKRLTHAQVTKMMQSYGNISTKGALKYFCGEKVGHGVSRDVYALKQDPEHYVVKLQRRDDSFDNIKEWLIWCEIGNAPAIAKWFAPLIVITTVGTVVVQERVKFDRLKKDYPEQVPIFFCDLKIENFGWKGNQLVCVDYASVYFSRLIDIKKGEVTQFRKTKSAWWSQKALWKRKKNK